MKGRTMYTSRESLSSRETSALMQVQRGGKLDAEYRRIADRLIHLGLIDQTSRGLRVTPTGFQLCMVEAQRRGLDDGKEPSGISI
jgi:hypothetical protein